MVQPVKMICAVAHALLALTIQLCVYPAKTKTLIFQQTVVHAILVLSEMDLCVLFVHPNVVLAKIQLLHVLLARILMPILLINVRAATLDILEMEHNAQNVVPIVPPVVQMQLIVCLAQMLLPIPRPNVTPVWRDTLEM